MRDMGRRLDGILEGMWEMGDGIRYRVEFRMGFGMGNGDGIYYLEDGIWERDMGTGYGVGSGMGDSEVGCEKVE